MKVLFVCTGNTCRSVLAHRWLEKLAADRGLAVEVRSAGVAADPSSPVPEEVRQVLQENGADPGFTHRPRRLDAELAGWADLILVMQEIHRALIARQFPKAAAKTHLLLDRAGLGRDAEVPDPVGRGADAYRATLASLREALEKLAAELPKER